MPIPQICFFKMFLHQRIVLFQELLVFLMPFITWLKTLMLETFHLLYTLILHLAPKQ